MNFTEMPLPKWVDATDPLSVQDFKLRLAALYHNNKGSTKYLALDIGMTQSGLCQYIVTPENSVLIESRLSRSLFPREFFRPDIFVVESPDATK